MTGTDPDGPGRDALAELARALAFAAERHRHQLRKDADRTPYINHLIAVVGILVEHGVRDGAVLAAAALHDVVEDTPTTPEEIEAEFGPRVRGLVAEVTDDKRLDREERKRIQIEAAPGTSPDATLIKLADKIANARDVTHRPAANWSAERRLDYLRWAAAVVDRLPPVAPGLAARFRAAHAEGMRLVTGSGPVPRNAG